MNDSSTMNARYTTENAGYSGVLLHLYRPTGTLSRFPMYDNIGTARGLVDASGTVTDTYELDTFGRSVSSTGTTPNPYRYGGAWGYIADPSGMLQLGERYYWPELGRFISQDPIRHGVNWYAYVDNNPLSDTDPAGTEGTRQHCNNLAAKFDAALAKGNCKEANYWLYKMKHECSRTLGLCGPELSYAARCNPPLCPLELLPAHDPGGTPKVCLPGQQPRPGKDYRDDW